MVLSNNGKLVKVTSSSWNVVAKRVSSVMAERAYLRRALVSSLGEV